MMPLMQEEVGFVERFPWLTLERQLLQLMLLHGKPIISLPLLHLVRRDTQLQRPM
ncbi:hypothetical protein D3C76_1748720 [compost metagenome]